MNKPHISIIVPVYNVAEYLIQCLDSCFNQTYAAIEVIAVNDGSKDNCGKILDDYAQKEPRLRVFHQENQGVVAARNVGITNAQGEWIMFVDSDDYITPDASEILINKALEEKVQIVVAQYCSVNTNGQAKQNANSADKILTGKKLIAQWLLTEKISFSLWAKLYHHSLFDGITHARNLKIGEDGYIAIQLFDKVEKVILIDNIVYFYVQHENSTMHKPSAAAVNSRLTYIDYVLNYYKKASYSNDNLFNNCKHRFVMNELFGYFLMNGSYDDIPKSLKETIKICLNDKKAIEMLPLQRKLIIKSYALNTHIGQLTIKIYKTLKRFR